MMITRIVGATPSFKGRDFGPRAAEFNLKKIGEDVSHRDTTDFEDYEKISEVISFMENENTKITEQKFLTKANMVFKLNDGKKAINVWLSTPYKLDRRNGWGHVSIEENLRPESLNGKNSRMIMITEANGHNIAKLVKAISQKAGCDEDYIIDAIHDPYWGYSSWLGEDVEARWGKYDMDMERSEQRFPAHWSIR